MDAKQVSTKTKTKSFQNLNKNSPWVWLLYLFFNFKEMFLKELFYCLHHVPDCSLKISTPKVNIYQPFLVLLDIYKHMFFHRSKLHYKANQYNKIKTKKLIFILLIQFLTSYVFPKVTSKYVVVSKLWKRLFSFHY